MGQGAGKQVNTTNNTAPIAIAEKPLETKPQETLRVVQVPQGIVTSRLRLQRNGISPEQRKKLNSSKIYDKLTGSQWDEHETIQKLINLHILPQTTKPTTFQTPKKNIFSSNNKEITKAEAINISNTSRNQEYYSNRKSLETDRLNGNNNNNIFSHSPDNTKRNNYVSLDPIRSSQPQQINSVRKVYQPPKSVRELMKPTKISNTIRYVKAPLQSQKGSALQVRLILEDHQYKLEQLQSQYGQQKYQLSSEMQQPGVFKPLINSFVEDFQSHKKEEPHNEHSEKSIIQSNRPNFSSEMILKPMEMNNRSIVTTAATVNNKSSRGSALIHSKHNDSQESKPYPSSILETLDNPEGEDNLTQELLKKKKLSVKERILALEKLPPVRVDLSKLPLMNRIGYNIKDTSSRKAISEGAQNNNRVRQIRINSVDNPSANRRLDIIKIQYLEKYLGHKS